MFTFEAEGVLVDKGLFTFDADGVLEDKGLLVMLVVEDRVDTGLDFEGCLWLYNRSNTASGSELFIRARLPVDLDRLLFLVPMFLLGGPLATFRVLARLKDTCCMLMLGFILEEEAVSEAGINGLQLPHFSFRLLLVVEAEGNGGPLTEASSRRSSLPARDRV